MGGDRLGPSSVAAVDGAAVDDRSAGLLGQALTMIKLQGSVFYRAELRGPFGLEIDSPPGKARFHFVASGGLYIHVASAPASIALRAGDIFLVIGGVTHCLMDRPARQTIPMAVAKTRSDYRLGGPLRWGRGDPCSVLICGEFEFQHDFARALFRGLPSVLLSPRDSQHGPPRVHGLLQMISAEMEADTLAGQAIKDRLAELVMLTVLRMWLMSHPDVVSALTAIRDPRIGRAVMAVHGDPARRWTVSALAREAGMSRAAFASRFRTRMGVAPMEYVTDWRMHLASHLLRTEQITIDEAGAQVGYATQASFAKAFRRTFGLPPGRYRTHGAASSGPGFASRPTGSDRRPRR